MSFVTELYRVKLIISVVTLVNFLSILIISYILFSPKSFLNLPKRTTSRHEDQILNKSVETNGYHKSSISEHVEDDEEDDIEVYGPSHLLLSNSNSRSWSVVFSLSLPLLSVLLMFVCLFVFVHVQWRTMISSIRNVFQNWWTRKRASEREWEKTIWSFFYINWVFSSFSSPAIWLIPVIIWTNEINAGMVVSVRSF